MIKGEQGNVIWNPAKYDFPFLAFNDGHVGEIEITDLINTVGDFKQAADINQL
jgi:hypothetical protein